MAATHSAPNLEGGTANNFANTIETFRSACFSEAVRFKTGEVELVNWTDVPATLQSLGEGQRTELLVKFTGDDEKYLAITVGSALSGDGEMITCALAFRADDHAAFNKAVAASFDMRTSTPIPVKGALISSLGNERDWINISSDPAGWMLVRRFIPVDDAALPMPPAAPVIRPNES